MEKLQQPNFLGFDQMGNMAIYTVGGLDAQQIVTAKTTLFSSFIKVQEKINQPTKDKQGASFKNGGSYKYADLNSVISVIQAACQGIDIAYIQQPVRDGGKAGVQNYLINSKGAIADFGAYLLDVGGSSPQAAGGALTYARRYSISCIFGIASEEDTDAMQYERAPEFMAPVQIEGIQLAYNGKRKPLVEIYALAAAGDTLAQSILKDKGNPVNAKIAIKSLNSIFKFNEELFAEKEKAEKTIKKAEQKAEEIIKKAKQKAEQEEKVKTSTDQADSADPFAVL